MNFDNPGVSRRRARAEGLFALALVLGAIGAGVAVALATGWTA